MPFPAFAMFTSLKTDRLRLRPVAPEDAPAVQSLISDWEIARQTGRIPHPYPEGGAAKWIADIRVCQAAGLALGLAIERIADGRLIGCITLEADPSGKPPALGYWIGREGWGRGYATEVVRGLAAWAFGIAQVPEIEALVFPGNPASIRVLEKAGFRQMGRGTHPAPARGGEREVLLYALRRPGEDLRVKGGL